MHTDESLMVFAFTYDQLEEWVLTWPPILFMALIVFFHLAHDAS